MLLVGLNWPLGAQTRLVFETAENLKPFAPAMATRFRAADLAADIHFVPAARLAEDLREGTIDGAFFVTEQTLTADTDYLLIPVPLYKNDYVAISQAGLPPIRRREDLAAFRVAYVRGNATLVTLSQSAGEAYPAVDEEQAFRLLGAARVQVVLASRTSAQLFGPAAGVPLKVHEPPLLSSPLFLCLKASLTPARDALTRVLKASVDDGSWARDVRAVIDGLSKR